MWRDHLLHRRDLADDVLELRIEDLGHVKFTRLEPVENASGDRLRVTIAHIFDLSQINMVDKEIAHRRV